MNRRGKTILSTVRFGLGRSVLATVSVGLAFFLMGMAEVYADSDTDSAGGAKAAAKAPSADPMRAMLEERMSEIPSGEEGVNRLLSELTREVALSEQQQKEIRPIFEKMVATMQASKERFEAGTLSPMGVGMQVQMAARKAAKQIETHLDEEQKVKYAAILQAQRQQMMKAMQKARAAAAAQ